MQIKVVKTRNSFNEGENSIANVELDYLRSQTGTLLSNTSLVMIRFSIKTTVLMV